MYDPRLLCERLAEISLERRRLSRLRGTPGHVLLPGHIDSLEFLEHLRSTPPQVIYDVGANVGTWTLLAKSIFPHCTVHAFEPLSAHASKFPGMTAGLTNVHLHKVALGAITEDRSMQVTDFSDASSFLTITDESKRRFNLSVERQEPVRVERLDDYVEANRMPLPDLIKLDIQGFEVEALKGAERTLGRVSAVISEVSFIELYEGQALFHDVVGFLARHNFRLAMLSATTAVGRPLVYSDALFLRARC